MQQLGDSADTAMFFFLVFSSVSDPSLIFLKITWELLLLWRLCLHVQKPVCTYSCLCRLRIHILVSIQVIHEHPGGVRVFISCCDSLPARIWQVGDSATLSSPNNQRVNKLKQKWVTTMSNWQKSPFPIPLPSAAFQWDFSSKHL